MRTLRYWPVVLGALLALVGLVPAATVAADSGLHAARAADAAERRPRRALARGRARALLARLAPRARAHATRRAADPDGRGDEAELAAARQRLRVARHTLKTSERSLASRLQLLYEQGDTDPLAVVLGASSVADALGNLDSLDRIADQDRVVIEQTQHAKHTAAALTRGLAAKEQHLQGLAQEASQSTLVLEQARSQRASYLATLAGQQKLNAAVDRRVPAAGARRRGEGPRGLGRRADATGDADPDRARRHVTDGRRHRLLAPRPHGHRRADRLGRRRRRPERDPARDAMTIPGYGSGVAADTGSAIQGATIDLWFPTVAQARAWGRRTVTITLH